MEQPCSVHDRWHHWCLRCLAASTAARQTTPPASPPGDPNPTQETNP